jgi:hypothetical protein
MTLCKHPANGAKTHDISERYDYTTKGGQLVLGVLQRVYGGLAK